MSQRAKILAVLIIISIIGTIFLIFSSSKTEKNISESAKIKKIQPIDLTMLEENYKNNVKLIVDEYVQSAKIDESDQSASGELKEDGAVPSSPSGNVRILSLEKMVGFKERLLALKVPTAFKDLHLNLILAFNKAENYLTGHDRKNLNESLALIESAKSEYIWLK